MEVYFILTAFCSNIRETFSAISLPVEKLKRTFHRKQVVLDEEMRWLLHKFPLPSIICHYHTYLSFCLLLPKPSSVLMVKHT